MLAASLGPLLSSRVFPGHLFFPSSLNPADDPTRHLSARAPSCRKPAWWIALEDGNSSPLEAFLLEREDAAANNFEQTDLLELGGSRPVVFQSNRERESRRPRLQAQRSRLARNPPKEVLRLPCNELAGAPSPATTPVCSALPSWTRLRPSLAGRLAPVRLGSWRRTRLGSARCTLGVDFQQCPLA